MVMVSKNTGKGITFTTQLSTMPRVFILCQSSPLWTMAKVAQLGGPKNPTLSRWFYLFPLLPQVKGLKESVITRSSCCDHSAVASLYEWSQVHSPHLSPFSLLAGKNLNTTAVIPLSYSTFKQAPQGPWVVPHSS